MRRRSPGRSPPRPRRPSARRSRRRKPSSASERFLSRARAPRTRTSTEVFVAIGLGANLGRPENAFRLALRALAPDLVSPRLSSLWRSAPAGGPPQPDYVNAVLTGWTRLPALDLLSRLKRIERRAGRRPGGPRNGPRPLDLDLLLYGSLVRRGKRLSVPHPRMARRLFVLLPLAEVAPRRVVPGLRKTVARLAREAGRDREGEVRRLKRGLRPCLAAPPPAS